MANLFALLDDDAGDVDPAQLARVAAAKEAAKAAAKEAVVEAEAAAKAATEKAAAEAEARFYEEHGYDYNNGFYYNDEGRRFYGANRHVDRRFGNYMGSRGGYGGGRGRGEYKVGRGGKGYQWVEKKVEVVKGKPAVQAEGVKDKPVEGGDQSEQGSESNATDQSTESSKPVQGASDTAATSGETKPEDGDASVQASEESKTEQESSEQAKKKSKKKKKKVDPNTKHPAYEKKQEGPEEPDNSLTLDVYEKLLQEKRKALEAPKTEVRKVVANKEFDGMTVVGKKIQEEEDFIMLQKSEEVKKLKQKESLDEKAKADSKKVTAPKVVSINEFLRGYEGLRRGGRGYNGGNREAYSGGRGDRPEYSGNSGYGGGYSNNGGYKGGYTGNGGADGGYKGSGPVGRDIVPNGGDSSKASPDAGEKAGVSVVRDVVPNGESSKGQLNVVPNVSVHGGAGGAYRRGGSGYSGWGGGWGGANSEDRGGYGYSGRGGANGENRGGYRGGANHGYSGRGGAQGGPVKSPAARVVKVKPAHSFEDPAQFPALKQVVKP